MLSSLYCFISLTLILLGVGFAAEYSCSTPPFIDGAKKFMGGIISGYDGSVSEVFSPIIDSDKKSRFVIGKLAQMTSEDSLEALAHAKAAWNYGRGVWPQMSTEERIKAMEDAVSKLRERRSEIVTILQWEIAKSSKDAGRYFTIA